MTKTEFRQDIKSLRQKLKGAELKFSNSKDMLTLCEDIDAILKQLRSLRDEFSVSILKERGHKPEAVTSTGSAPVEIVPQETKGDVNQETK